jgi:hypothetical protein
LGCHRAAKGLGADVLEMMNTGLSPLLSFPFLSSPLLSSLVLSSPLLSSLLPSSPFLCFPHFSFLLKAESNFILTSTHLY